MSGLCKDGGLYMPTEIPKMDENFQKIIGMKFPDMALKWRKTFKDEIENYVLEK